MGGKLGTKVGKEHVESRSRPGVHKRANRHSISETEHDAPLAATLQPIRNHRVGSPHGVLSKLLHQEVDFSLSDKSRPHVTVPASFISMEHSTIRL